MLRRASRHLRWLLAASAAVALAAPAPPARAALTEVSEQHLDPRLLELTFTTPALAAPTHVRVLLPSNFDPTGRTRYPVLYLLHGSVDDYRSWTDKGAAEAITAGLPLIVVMPDGGQVGNYTNWFNDGAFGQPEWETYHVDELLPWIDQHYPTLGTRAGRAVAGLSMGGGGAMAYAALHPDLFVAAASFSGAVDTNNTELQPVTEAGGLSDGSHSPGAIYGLRSTEEIRWRGHNPWDLAENLRGLFLTLRTGNGMPGGPYGDTGDPVEADVHDQSVSLHNQLAALGIAHIWDDYGPGSHSWPYWQRDLRETLPDLMRTFASPPPAPSPFTYRSISPAYGVYGWDVAVTRPALEFSELRDASASGFELFGSGTAVVTTAPLFRPGAAVLATVRSAAGTASRPLQADRSGRVRIPLTLGPGNPYQEYSAQAAVAGTAVYSTEVKLTAEPSLRCRQNRTVHLRLTGLRRADVRTVRLYVDGHRRATLHGPRQTVTVRLAHAARILLIVNTRGGRTVRIARRSGPVRC